MIPTGGQIDTDELQEVQLPSRTYRLDLDKKRATGTVDGLDAVRQAVLKILQTERYDYLIYSFDYGSETAGITGRSPEIVQSELTRRIREALLQDDRINDVTDMQITVSGDSALATFTVVSDQGSFEGGVTVGV
ncbi:DUF2634 domain-containing protein [Cohnella silvisoli]|uniref:DUF2634 domain-containing protein n=1 Tax=Cohnella silvisoli TaxID=2873699 RepID=A0ABV1L3Z3_9BACL|nr:DUF2634 domain-containing protein [Cohnella silvisoli]MCD9026056.1 DUF2634 domain-containing protein [Cohnella silvisoli]